jgi:hypothetical protein
VVDISKFPRGVPGRDLRNNIAPFAAWADPNKIGSHPFWKYESGKILVGAVGRNLIGVNDDRHLMTIAGSRAGKGVSAIIPNLLEYPGSVLVIDPKGENASKTAVRRSVGTKEKPGLGQHVYVLDPFGVSGFQTQSFNPLSMIDPGSDTAVDDAALGKLLTRQATQIIGLAQRRREIIERCGNSGANQKELPVRLLQERFGRDLAVRKSNALVARMACPLVNLLEQVSMNRFEMIGVKLTLRTKA